MRRLLTILALAACIAVCLAACDDLFEKDLTDKEVVIIAPSDGITVESGGVSFLWNEVEGAASYRFRLIGTVGGQLALPLVDTLMHNDSTGVKCKFRCDLGEGEYRWSVAARNSVYETPESVRTLHVIAPPPVEIPEDEE